MSFASRRKGYADWLPDILRDAGLPVIVEPGYETRGKKPTEWLAQANHHTASNRFAGIEPARGIVRDGRGGAAPVPGPLANTLPRRDGTIRIIAAGAANHPGVGRLELPGRAPITSGLKYVMLGHEIELDGIGEPFPTNSVLYENVARMNAAIAIYLGWDPEATLFDHKAIAQPPGRKIDVRPYDLTAGRRYVSRLVAATLPVTEPAGPPAPPITSTEEAELMSAKDDIITEIKATLPWAVRVSEDGHGMKKNQVWICDAFQRRRAISRDNLNFLYYTGQVQMPKGGPMREPLILPSVIAELEDVTRKAA